MDSKHDATGGSVHPDGCELSNDDKESWAAEIPGYLMDDIYPMDILPNSSHRDGSIYSGHYWKNAHSSAAVSIGHGFGRY